MQGLTGGGKSTNSYENQCQNRYFEVAIWEIPILREICIFMKISGFLFENAFSGEILNFHENDRFYIKAGLEIIRIP